MTWEEIKEKLDSGAWTLTITPGQKYDGHWNGPREIMFTFTNEFGKVVGGTNLVVLTPFDAARHGLMPPAQ
jgi:hypothetical protein